MMVEYIPIINDTKINSKEVSEIDRNSLKSNTKDDFNNKKMITYGDILTLKTYGTLLYALPSLVVPEIVWTPSYDLHYSNRNLVQ